MSHFQYACCHFIVVCKNSFNSWWLNKQLTRAFYTAFEAVFTLNYPVFRYIDTQAVKPFPSTFWPTNGSTFDQTFSFARKVPGQAGWGYIDLREIEDVPNINEEKGEFLTYMERVGGGDEFRQNGEMLAKWFDEKGMVKVEEVQRAKSVYDIITPSPERAYALNKAYLTIVKEQSYLFGRDATLTKATNVLSTIDAEQPPLKPEHRFKWDMRLNWQQEKPSAIAEAR